MDTVTASFLLDLGEAVVERHRRQARALREAEGDTPAVHRAENLAEQMERVVDDYWTAARLLEAFAEADKITLQNLEGKI